MSQPDYLISTPENVDLHLELAGMGNRVMACLIDTTYTYLIVLLISVATMVGAALLHYLHADSGTESIMLYTLIGIAIMASLVVYFGYYIFFEGLWHGQTPGKRAMRIRVIEQNGQPVSWASVFIRNLIRVVDTGIGLIGLLVMLVDKNERRLGDLAGGTLVIRERLPDEITGNTQLTTTAVPDGSVDVGRISPREYDLLYSFLGRREKLHEANRREIAERMSSYFRNRLGVDGIEDPAEMFLEKIYLAYQQRAL